MRNENIELLNSLYEDAAAGADAIKKLLPEVSGAPLRAELLHRLNRYGEITSNIVSTFGYYGEKPKQPQIVRRADIWSRFGGANRGDAGVAEAVLNGTAMSIIRRSRDSERIKNADPAVAVLCGELTRTDNDGVDRIKAFLC